MAVTHEDHVASEFQRLYGMTMAEAQAEWDAHTAQRERDMVAIDGTAWRRTRDGRLYCYTDRRRSWIEAY